MGLFRAFSLTASNPICTDEYPVCLLCFYLRDHAGASLNDGDWNCISVFVKHLGHTKFGTKNTDRHLISTPLHNAPVETNDRPSLYVLTLNEELGIETKKGPSTRTGSGNTQLNIPALLQNA